MKLWKDNKIMGEWELPNAEVADRFLASKFGDLDEYPWPLERAFPVFVGAKEDDGGLSSSYVLDSPQALSDHKAVLRLIQAARNAQWAGEAAGR